LISNYFNSRSVKAIIIARDVEQIELEGGLNDQLQQLSSLGKKNKVFYYYSYVVGSVEFNFDCRFL
jgi:hypothetical protein